MAKQTFAFHVTHYYSDDNEWLTNRTITKIKKLWKNSGGDQNHSDHKKARDALKPHIQAKFDPEYVVDKISDLIAVVDEDGWLTASEESLTYGLRKSIFTSIDLDDYEPAEVDSLDLVDLHFYELDENDDVDNTKIGNGIGITVLCMVNAEVKEILPDIDYLEKWIDKFELDFSRLFKVELGDSLTTYLDEDGDETSGYSCSTLNEGYLMGPPSMPLAELREIAIADALGNETAAEISAESVGILKAISSGVVNDLVDLLKSRSIDKPLIPGAQNTAPLPLIFSSLVSGPSVIEDTVNSLDKEIEFKLPEQEVLIEMIYALASLGANLQYRIADSIGYLEIAIMCSEELTEFLLSFGLDALDGGGDALLVACEKGRIDLVQRFLDEGADVDFCGTEGTTALLIASQGKSNVEPMLEEEAETYISIAGMLLRAGANIEQIDQGGDSALTNAVRVNGILMCRFLVEKGASLNPQMSSSEAVCPLELARDRGFEELASLLESLGSTTDRLVSKKSKSTRSEVSPPSDSVSVTPGVEIIREANLTDKLPCPGCGKTFTVRTLRKWGEQCHSCYSKSGAGTTKKTKKSASKKKSSPAPNPGPSAWSSIGSFFEGLFSFVEALFELLKALAILGIGILIIVAILAALFSG